jgi:alanyl-tRNA synthetase
MNQFVPIFLGERQPDVSRWANAIAGSDTRAADTQKCIRAGGKHNDLDDVGLDTYHHTFFEMLGNWSFGDYFKKEAIEWAWELIVERWKFPAERLYATVYKPGKGDPSEFDKEAFAHWEKLFTKAGLDPKIHIVNGNKKDNFWMMGDTGPCGPCSEIHVDLTPNGDTKGKLVNAGDSRCMEIWNLVFIQYNANPDGTFSALPAKHVDTGMGFERVTSIIQGTNGFSDFKNARISNYETDIFRPLFDEIGALAGITYGSTLPKAGSTGETEQERTDVAFRVIADHIRTLTFAVADGISPGNTDRNYVLRRILRRAVRYGRTLGFREPFFHKLVKTLVAMMGDAFPELKANQKRVEEILATEEESFNRTLDKGIALFEEEAAKNKGKEISGAFAFRLYDEQGFPLDLTELMARERGMSVDNAGFEKLMEGQREKARSSQKKKVIELSQIETKSETNFIGFENLSGESTVDEVVQLKDTPAIIVRQTPFYAALGGQVGDTGVVTHADSTYRIISTQKSGDVWLHMLEGDVTPNAGDKVKLHVDVPRRRAIERHHTVTHILHWALHEVVSKDATQKGSFVGPDKLTFDFNNNALSPQQVRDVEQLVNERILENASVSWTEVPYREVKEKPQIQQFFEDKYGEVVRVVQIGGQRGTFDGYSMELCGGTHTRATGEIGLFRIVSEGAVAAGVRRIEAIAGLSARDSVVIATERLHAIAAKLNSPVGEIEKKLEAMLAQQKELEKAMKAANQRGAADEAAKLLKSAETNGEIPSIVANVKDWDGDTVQAIVDAVKTQFKGVVVLASAIEGNITLIANVHPELTSQISAGKIIQSIAPIVEGRGGGKPDNARGGGKNAAKLDDALIEARRLIAEAGRSSRPQVGPRG